MTGVVCTEVVGAVRVVEAEIGVEVGIGLVSGYLDPFAQISVPGCLTY